MNIVVGQTVDTIREMFKEDVKKVSVMVDA